MHRLLSVKITFWRVIQVGIILVGLYATINRFSKGLGAATGLSDSSPWGIWIGFDILCGVALAAGGFTLAAVVYVFKLERYRPILRATILTAFLGYLMAIVSLLFDIGQPWRIWHPLVMWNEHSPMFEVAICVMLYTTVLALEFSPAVFEWLHLERPLKIVHMLTPPLVVAGVLLSTLHQSTLGTLFVIVPEKVHGLWYTPFLPVLFYVSAISVGPAMVIFESSMSHRAFGTDPHGDILKGLGKAISIVVAVYLVLRFVTLLERGNLGLIFEGSPESYLFILEIGLGFILPMVLFASLKIRDSQQGRFYASLLLILGVVMNRLNVSTTGLARYSNYSYFPSFLEIFTTLFIIVCGITAFSLIVRYLPIFPKHDETEDKHQSHGSYGALDQVRLTAPGAAQPRIATPKGVAVLAALVVIFAAFAYMIKPSVSPVSHPEEDKASVFLQEAVRKINVKAKDGILILPADYTFVRSGLSPGKVVFSHRRHVSLGAEACTNCHPKTYPMLTPNPSQNSFHTEKMYGCSSCHDGVRTFSTDGECKLCHGQKPDSKPAVPDDFLIPSGSNGVGPVRITHAKHMAASGSKCLDCHPRPFLMTKPGSTFGKIKDFTKRMDEGHQCSKCHNGKKAFAMNDDCTRCHVSIGRSSARMAPRSAKR